MGNFSNFMRSLVLWNAFNPQEFRTYEEFMYDIMTQMELACPKEWRKGQFVFNYVNMKYGDVARDVQFVDKVDCFYRDDLIEDFTKCVWKRLNGGNQ